MADHEPCLQDGSWNFEFPSGGKTLDRLVRVHRFSWRSLRKLGRTGDGLLAGRQAGRHQSRA